MITPWVGLLLVNAVAVATFARCFSGPGELAIVVPVCLGAQLLAHLGRHVRRNGHLGAAIAIWVLAIFLVAYVPLALVDGATFRLGLLPLSHTWRVLGHQFSDSWAIFSNRVAPVMEAPGLVLAAAWAGGGVALASEALDADTTLPAIVALVPAFDIIIFTGTLGTATGRAPELAAAAALSVWYLSGTRRLSGERVVTARVEGSSGGRAAVVASPLRSGRRAPSAVAGLALVAGISAGVIGPLLPGATSSALLAWHASGKSSPLNKNGPTGGGLGPISISSFVDVGEEEIDNANVPLFRVFGSTPTREILYVDDVFTGTLWKQQPSDLRTPVAPFTASLASLERQPPSPSLGRNQERLTQVIKNIDLIQTSPVPVPAVTDLAMDSNPPATLVGTNGPVLLPPGAFGNNYAYGVQASVTSSPQVAQEYYDPRAPGAPAVDLALPGTVPLRISDLAKSLVSSSMNEEEKGFAIENFLLSHYRYVLPKTVPSTPPGAYAGLENFLFVTRSGYCQQFASAFGVLARIDGLPTRVVVGFLPTAESHGSWLVTGAETHAWPQVYFPGTGWVDFEPTPGSSTPTYPNITTTTLPGASTTTTTVTGVSLPRGSHFGHPPGGGGPSGFAYPTVPPAGGGGSTQGGSGGVATVLVALLAGALLWALVVPSWRILRARRTRDPVRAVLLAWREALAVLAATGIHRRRAETAHEFTRRVRMAGVLSAGADDALARLADSTDHALFARLPPSAEESRRAAGDSAVVRRSARRSMNLWGKVVLQLDPRDLLTSP